MYAVCGRPECDEPAAATFGFDGGRAVVWLHPLDELEGAGRLCTRHADALVVPRGWTLHDRRKPAHRRGKKAPRRDDAPRRAEPTVPAPTPAVRPLTLPFPEHAGRPLRRPAWAKRVDPDDAVGALLEVGSPLLSRAFRNARDT